MGISFVISVSSFRAIPNDTVRAIRDLKLTHDYYVISSLASVSYTFAVLQLDGKCIFSTTRFNNCHLGKSVSKMADQTRKVLAFN